MELLIKGAALGVIASILVLVIKKNTPELALLLALSAAVLILGLGFSLIDTVTAFLDNLLAKTGISAALFAPVLKCMGIGVVARIASDVCKDAGNTTAASCVELVAAVSGVCVSIPLMRTVIQMLESFL